MRATKAMEKNANVTAGRMMDSGPSAPAAGNHLSLMENTIISISPNIWGLPNEKFYAVYARPAD